jgi:hypothetical protein
VGHSHSHSRTKLGTLSVPSNKMIDHTRSIVTSTQQIQFNHRHHHYQPNHRHHSIHQCLYSFHNMFCYSNMPHHGDVSHYEDADSLQVLEDRHCDVDQVFSRKEQDSYS